MGGGTFRVIRAGGLVSIQDQGRPGLLRYGVPASGPMDTAGFRAAAAMLGNPGDLAAIEVSLAGLELECLHGETTLALAGGGFQANLGGVPIGAWCRFRMRAGERLRIVPGRWGSWAYLAFQGGLQAHGWLGSASTHMRAGLGGGAVQAGQLLHALGGPVLAPRFYPCPVFARPRPVARVVLGPQDRCFPPEAVAALLNSDFSLTDAYDRMGVRLRGPSLLPLSALSLPSEAVVRGSIQVAGDGVATVLLADHQTTGGYPKIATMLSVDLDGFVQLRPRSILRFRAVSPAEAVAAARVHHAALGRYLSRLSDRP